MTGVQTCALPICAWKRGSHHADARVFANGEILVGYRERKRGDKPDSGDDCYGNCHVSVSLNHLTTQLPNFSIRQLHKPREPHERKTEKPARNERDGNAAEAARGVGVSKFLANAGEDH